MAADILDSKRLKVECVCECVCACVCVCVCVRVCVSQRMIEEPRNASFTASYLSERCSHTQNLEQHTGTASVLLSPFCLCLTACQSSMIMIIGCEVNNLLINAKWELD